MLYKGKVSLRGGDERNEKCAAVCRGVACIRAGACRRDRCLEEGLMANHLMHTKNMPSTCVCLCKGEKRV